MSVAAIWSRPLPAHPSKGKERACVRGAVGAVWAGRVAVASIAIAAACGTGEASTPSRVDVPLIAETLRRASPRLARSCDGGFPAFVEAAREAIADLEGSGPFLAEWEAYARPGGGLAYAALADPATFRLLLHRYGDVCRGPASRDLARQIAPLTGVTRDEASRRLLEVLESRSAGLPGLVVRALPGGQAVVAEVPATRGETAEAVTFLACLVCREGSPIDGPTQISSALAAFETVAASRIAMDRPLRLVVCLDSSAKTGACAEGFDDDLRGAAAAIALDGVEPLVVSWSAEVAWHLEIAHQPLGPAVASGPGARSAGPIVIDAAAPGELDVLPAAAWMVLADPAVQPGELVARVQAEAGALEVARPGTRFDVEPVGDGSVRVTARGEQLPAWEISRLRNALWDLSALAASLGVDDPPRGGLAAMLRVVQRFDRDPQGRRLGLHYADPLGGPLLVAPSSLAVREGKAILAVRMYRPAGMGRRAFLARLDEARRRLRLAAGRPVGEAAREVADPSAIEPSSETVRVVQRAFEEVVGEGIPEPTGVSRPSLGTLVPEAVAVRLPTQPTRVCRAPAVAVLVELIWRMAVATDVTAGRESDR